MPRIAGTTPKLPFRGALNIPLFPTNVNLIGRGRAMNTEQLIAKAKSEAEVRLQEKVNLERRLQELNTEIFKFEAAVKFLEDTRQEESEKLAEAGSTGDEIRHPRVLPGGVIDTAIRCLGGKGEMPTQALAELIRENGHGSKPRRNIVSQLVKHAAKPGSYIASKGSQRKKVWFLAETQNESP